MITRSPLQHYNLCPFVIATPVLSLLSVTGREASGQTVVLPVGREMDAGFNNPVLTTAAPGIWFHPVTVLAPDVVVI